MLLHVAEEVPLAPLTTFEVGGAARFLAEVDDEEELAAAFAWAKARSLPVFVLGGGSNLVVADRGLDAMVVRLRARGARFSPGDGGAVVVRAVAAEPWDALVERCVARDLAGLECLSGIPGQVGATPIQNVGAYGQEVADTLREVEVFRPATGAIEVWSRERCDFAYRDSAFKRAARGEHVVLAVTFALTHGGAPTVRYAELEKHLAQRGIEPRVGAVRAAVLELRRAKSMVIDPADENRRSAGSFFTNPIVAVAEVDAVRERARARGALADGETMPAFAHGEERVKLSAGWLIERAGFPRGTTRGSVGLSTRHALALVNRGGATASDVIAFAREVRDGVLSALGVRLVVEPELWGFTPAELDGLR
jgi:UDP-N-acetylmuramate dehydrogenase